MTIISRSISNANSIEAVAGIVNDAENLVEGVEGYEFTAAQLAGQYAAQAARDNDTDGAQRMSDDELEAHLDCLHDAGAEFDFRGALDHAKTLRDLYRTVEANPF